MSDEELIRAIFARIAAAPAAERPELRRKIVRQLLGECPTEPPEQAEEVWGDDNGHDAG